MTDVLTNVKTRDLQDCLRIPLSVREKIIDQYKNDGEQRQQCITYSVQYSPYSTSWIFLAGDLHRFEETSAEGLIMKFLQGTPGVGVACVCGIER